MAGTFDSLQTLNTDIAEIFGTWQDRLRETCEMTSPTGKTFSPLWAGSPRSFTKKLGRFNFPKVKGTYIQDLDVTGDVYPMVVYFEGKDHDKTAKSFFTALKERGRWSVSHPVHGSLNLQLASCEELDDPIQAGNTSPFTLEFLSSIDLADIGKPASAIALTEQQIILTNAATLIQSVNNFITDTFKDIATIVNTLDSARIIINTVMEPLRTLSNEINSAVDGINTSLDSTLDAAIFDPIVVAGQFQQLLQLPALIDTNINTKLSYYEEIANQIFSNPVTETNSSGINQAVSQEFLMSACLVGIAQSTINGSINSRAEALSINYNIWNFFTTMIDTLDDYQVLFRNLPIERQYFSQSSAFPEIARLTGLAIKYINSQVFNLAVERRFTLKTYRSPWDIAVTEYGGMGINDSNIYKFIYTNNLHGNEILVLPPGREVVIYA